MTIVVHATATPVGAADPFTEDAVVYEYDVPGGASSAVGFGISSRPCGPEWRAWSEPGLEQAVGALCDAADPEGDGILRIGIHAPSVPTPATLIVDDDRFDHAYVTVQVDASHGRVLRYAGCGTVDVPVEGSIARIFVYATHADPATGERCFGSSGSITVVSTG